MVVELVILVSLPVTESLLVGEWNAEPVILGGTLLVVVLVGITPDTKGALVEITV